MQRAGFMLGSGGRKAKDVPACRNRTPRRNAPSIQMRRDAMVHGRTDAQVGRSGTVAPLRDGGGGAPSVPCATSNSAAPNLFTRQGAPRSAAASAQFPILIPRRHMRGRGEETMEGEGLGLGSGTCEIASCDRTRRVAAAGFACSAALAFSALGARVPGSVQLQCTTGRTEAISCLNERAV